MESKWFLTSMTIWGYIVTAASTIGPVLGPFINVEVDPTEIQNVGASVTNVIQAVGAAVGSIMILWGRFRAKGPVTVTPV